MSLLNGLFRGLVGFSASTLSAGAFTYSQEWSGGKTLPKEHPQTASKSFSRQCLSAVIYRFPNPGEENPRKVALHQSENPPHHLLYAALLTGISFIFICICIFNYQGAHIRSLSASVVVGIFDVGLFGCYLGSCEGLGGLVSVVFVRSGLIVGCARMR